MTRRRITTLGLATLTLMAVAVLLWAAGSAGASPPLAPTAQSGAPMLLNYQGRLVDPVTGEPVPNAFYAITFRIYDAAHGGTLLWAETLTVQVEGGLFNVLLGSVTPLDAADFDGTARWLELEVEGETLAPRIRIVSTPYAIQAEWAKNTLNADLLDGQHGAYYLAWGNLTGMPAGFADGVDNDTLGGLSPCGDGQVAKWNDITSQWECGDVDGGTFWSLTGNAGTTSGTNFLGTTDSVSLTLAVSNTVALRLEPTGGTPNIIGGSISNTVAPGVVGATIGGGGASGLSNSVAGDYATVGGGNSNTAGDQYATVGGGLSNTASGSRATVAGGWENTASNSRAAVGGGRQNTASGANAFVGGGSSNIASGTNATVGGGEENVASYNYTTVGGGNLNTASGERATVGGGHENTASGNYATVGGGFQNTASLARATVGGGEYNTASGNYATVPGGSNNEAVGNYSFAAGRKAKANNNGCFVWGDSYNGDVACNNDNRTIFRSTGGFYIYTNGALTNGASLAPGGGAWSTFSDRNIKENFAPVDANELLARVAEIPISTWNYKSQDPSIRHIGPMAQDFNTLVEGLGGEGEKYINTLDADGVALAAIQALAAENAALREQVAALDNRVTALEAQSRSPFGGWGTLGLLFGGLLLGLVVVWQNGFGKRWP